MVGKEPGKEKFKIFKKDKLGHRANMDEVDAPKLSKVYIEQLRPSLPSRYLYPFS